MRDMPQSHKTLGESAFQKAQEQTLTLLNNELRSPFCGPKTIRFSPKRTNGRFGLNSDPYS